MPDLVLVTVKAMTREKFKVSAGPAAGTCPKIFDALNDASLLQGGICAVLRHGFNCPRGELYDDETLEFRNPETADLEVRKELAGGIGGDVTANAALLLGHAAAMYDVAFRGAGLGDGADSGHRFSPARADKLDSGAGWVKGFFGGPKLGSGDTDFDSVDGAELLKRD